MRYLIPFCLLLASCAVQKKAIPTTMDDLLTDSVLSHAHVGIAVYDVAEGRYIARHNAERYFVPASNTKLFSCYAGMKYLGDSLPGIQYAITAKGLVIRPTGDPTLLHPDYNRQPVVNFLKAIPLPLAIIKSNWQSEALGAGWSWDDYNDYYMAERSPLPVYGNILRWIQDKNPQANTDSLNPFDQSVSIYSLPEVNWPVHFNPDMKTKRFHVQRQRDANDYTITEGNESHKEQEVPFVTNGLQAALELLPDTIGKKITLIDQWPDDATKLETLYSQPADSMFRPMMHRSDNFFAEQTLLMVSNALLKRMDENAIIDTLLRSDFKDLPQRPHWADGSGLSRFNLFTPADFVWLLNKMKDDFGMDRLQNILATGGTGTLRNYYQQDSGRIFAKTGTLNGVVSISGYLYTRHNKLLLFSVLVNNHNGNTSHIRSRVQDFIDRIRDRY